MQYRNEYQKDWLDTRTLAAWLGVPEKTVQQWRHFGTGPKAHKFGRHVRYRRSDVEMWAAQRQAV